MKKKYSTPSVRVFKMEMAEMLMSSTNTNSVNDFRGNSNSMTINPGIIDTGDNGEGSDAGEAM